MKKSIGWGAAIPRYLTNKFLIRMKLLALLFFGLVFQSSATVVLSQQRINIDVKNTPVENVFKVIEGKSDYRFVYGKDVFNSNNLVNVYAKNATIDYVMEMLLQGTGLSYKKFSSNLVIVVGKDVQNIQAKALTGVVIDDQGKSLSGVSIIEKGTTNGVTTDVDGRFSINVKDENAILVISAIGYVMQEISVKDNNYSTIVLIRSENKLDEVVVVGYGTQKKINLTGAVATVDSKILEDRPVTRLLQGLQGTVANLNITNFNGGGAPNATPSFNIRGYTGLGTTQGPLVVIDGVQAGDINTINPNDVESISVIKDAAAAAIYGSSAPYGVLLITTKKGKTGKPVITYNNSFTINTPMGMPKMSNSLEFAQLYNEARANVGSGPFIDNETIQRIKDYMSGKITTETMANPATGKDEWYSWGSGNGNNDWFKVYFKDAQFLQQHNLNVSGGGDKTKYFVGLGYNDRPGMMRYGKDIYKRYNVRVNLNNKINNWLDFNIRTSYSKETFDRPWDGGGRTGENWMHNIARKHPNVPLRNPNGEFSDASEIPFMTGDSRHLEAWDKPLITGEIVVSPIKGWVNTVNYTYEANIWNNSEHIATLYEKLPSGKANALGFTNPNSFSRSIGFQYHYVLNAFSSYEFGLNRHNFKVLGGYVSELFDNMGLNGSNSGLYTDNVPSLSTTFGKTPSLTDSRRQLASIGYFGRLNYNFDEKYLLEIVGRYDGTSRFLSNSRWGFYPGFSAGWRVDRENFWATSGIDRWINTFKLRASYGSQGDQSFGDASNSSFWYPFYPALVSKTPTANGNNWYFSGGREATTSAPNLVNPFITWVKTNVLDFGVNITALNNRLSFDFDWYKRSAKDYLGPARDLPAILGTLVPQENSAAIETKGFDMTVSWKDRIGELTYTLRGILSNYKGVVTQYPNAQGLLSNWYVGKQMGEIWGYKTIGYFKGDADVAASPDQSYLYTRWGAGDIKYEDVKPDGKINDGLRTLSDHGDLVIIGNNTPKYQYGFYADFGWKNFDASFFIQGIGKRDFYFSDWNNNYFFGIQSAGSEWQSSVFQTHNDRWTPSTPDGYFPKYYMSGENLKNIQPQTKYLQNAAYMRLKNIQIGYTLPKTLSSKIAMQKLRFFAMAENVFTISPIKKHSYLDPELATAEAKIYPMQRSFSFGLNVTF